MEMPMLLNKLLYYIEQKFNQWKKMENFERNFIQNLVKEQRSTFRAILQVSHTRK